MIEGMKTKDAIDSILTPGQRVACQAFVTKK